MSTVHATYTSQYQSTLLLRSGTGNNNGKHFLLPRVPCDLGDEEFSIPGFKRILFPVCVCFAITTNKVQIQFFRGALGIHECFTHGQFYLFRSRIRHLSNNSLYSQIDVYPTAHVVYKSVLSLNLV